MGQITFDQACLEVIIGIAMGVLLIITINILKLATDKYFKKPKQYGWVVFPDPKTKKWTVIAWIDRDGVMLCDFDSQEEAARYAACDLEKHLKQRRENNNG